MKDLENNKKTAEDMQGVLESEIIQVDQAIESFRDSGFDLPTAAGEVIDNSYEANARIIRIMTYGQKDIEEVAFVDDGIGIKSEFMSQTLKLGFSTRYNNRTGLGRFGVGLKFASISIARRVDVYSRPSGDKNVYHSYLDLDLIRDNEQKIIKTEILKNFPQKYLELFLDKNGKEFASGTLILWTKVDRLKEGGSFGCSNQQKLGELREFISRAYRRFIDQGLNIELNGKKVELFDPLYLSYSKRTEEILGEDIRGEIIEEKPIIIDGKEVKYKVSLAPEIVRKVRGEGGNRGSASKFKDLHVERNERKVSILRNGREIYYDLVPYLLEGQDQRNKPDRFIGIEIEFPAELDEYFQVRNVKRGAQPVDKLFRQLQEALKRPIIEARKKIQNTWGKTADEDRKSSDEHEESMKAVTKAETTAPKGRGGFDVSQEKAEEVINNIIQDQGLDLDKDKELVEKKKEELKKLPITISDASWNGKELMEIHHLNGAAHVVINKRHIFFNEVYYPLKKIADSNAGDISAEDLIYYARLITSAIDVLIMAYAKAENMTENPDDQYSDLRTYWGINTAAYIRDLLKEIK